jgi:hypothetical protein
VIAYAVVGDGLSPDFPRGVELKCSSVRASIVILAP